VRKGFEEATGDILMILDADLSVASEDLPRFYEAIRTGRGELINGVRLISDGRKGHGLRQFARKQVFQSGLLLASRNLDLIRKAVETRNARRPYIEV